MTRYTEGYEKYGNAKAGLLERETCPDCRFRLAPLVKITEELAYTGVMARVCVNVKCWRFTQIVYQMTWKKA